MPDAGSVTAEALLSQALAADAAAAAKIRSVQAAHAKSSGELHHALRCATDRADDWEAAAVELAKSLATLVTTRESTPDSTRRALVNAENVFQRWAAYGVHGAGSWAALTAVPRHTQLDEPRAALVAIGSASYAAGVNLRYRALKDAHQQLQDQHAQLQAELRTCQAALASANSRAAEASAAAGTTRELMLSVEDQLWAAQESAADLGAKLEQAESSAEAAQQRVHALESMLHEEQAKSQAVVEQACQRAEQEARASCGVLLAAVQMGMASSKAQRVPARTRVELDQAAAQVAGAASGAAVAGMSQLFRALQAVATALLGKHSPAELAIPDALAHSATPAQAREQVLMAALARAEARSTATAADAAAARVEAEAAVTQLQALRAVHAQRKPPLAALYRASIGQLRSAVQARREAATAAAEAGAKLQQARAGDASAAAPDREQAPGTASAGTTMDIVQQTVSQAAEAASAQFRGLLDDCARQLADPARAGSSTDAVRGILQQLHYQSCQAQALRALLVQADAGREQAARRAHALHAKLLADAQSNAAAAERDARALRRLVDAPGAVGAAEPGHGQLPPALRAARCEILAARAGQEAEQRLAELSQEIRLAGSGEDAAQAVLQESSLDELVVAAQGAAQAAAAAVGHAVEQHAAACATLLQAVASARPMVSAASEGSEIDCSGDTPQLSHGSVQDADASQMMRPAPSPSRTRVVQTSEAAVQAGTPRAATQRSLATAMPAAHRAALQTLHQLVSDVLAGSVPGRRLQVLLREIMRQLSAMLESAGDVALHDEQADGQQAQAVVQLVTAATALCAESTPAAGLPATLLRALGQALRPWQVDAPRHQPAAQAVDVVQVLQRQVARLEDEVAQRDRTVADLQTQHEREQQAAAKAAKAGAEREQRQAEAVAAAHARAARAQSEAATARQVVSELERAHADTKSQLEQHAEHRRAGQAELLQVRAALDAAQAQLSELRTARDAAVNRATELEAALASAQASQLQATEEATHATASAHDMRLILARAVALFEFVVARVRRERAPEPPEAGLESPALAARMEQATRAAAWELLLVAPGPAEPEALPSEGAFDAASDTSSSLSVCSAPAVVVDADSSHSAPVHAVRSKAWIPAPGVRGRAEAVARARRSSASPAEELRPPPPAANSSGRRSACSALSHDSAPRAGDMAALDLSHAGAAASAGGNTTSSRCSMGTPRQSGASSCCWSECHGPASAPQFWPERLGVAQRQVRDLQAQLARVEARVAELQATSEQARERTHQAQLNQQRAELMLQHAQEQAQRSRTELLQAHAITATARESAEAAQAEARVAASQADQARRDAGAAETRAAMQAWIAARSVKELQRRLLALLSGVTALRVSAHGCKLASGAGSLRSAVQRALVGLKQQEKAAQLRARSGSPAARSTAASAAAARAARSRSQPARRVGGGYVHVSQGAPTRASTVARGRGRSRTKRPARARAGKPVSITVHMHRARQISEVLVALAQRDAAVRGLAELGHEAGGSPWQAIPAWLQPAPAARGLLPGETSDSDSASVASWHSSPAAPSSQPWHVVGREVDGIAATTAAQGEKLHELQAVVQSLVAHGQQQQSSSADHAVSRSSPMTVADAAIQTDALPEQPRSTGESTSTRAGPKAPSTATSRVSKQLKQRVKSLEAELSRAKRLAEARAQRLAQLVQSIDMQATAPGIGSRQVARTLQTLLRADESMRLSTTGLAWDTVPLAQPIFSPADIDELQDDSDSVPGTPRTPPDALVPPAQASSPVSGVVALVQALQAAIQKLQAQLAATKESLARRVAVAERAGAQADALGTEVRHMQEREHAALEAASLAKTTAACKDTALKAARAALARAREEQEQATQAAATSEDRVTQLSMALSNAEQQSAQLQAQLRQLEQGQDQLKAAAVSSTSERGQLQRALDAACARLLDMGTTWRAGLDELMQATAGREREYAVSVGRSSAYGARQHEIMAALGAATAEYVAVNRAGEDPLFTGRMGLEELPPPWAMMDALRAIVADRLQIEAALVRRAIQQRSASKTESSRRNKHDRHSAAAAASSHSMASGSTQYDSASTRTDASSYVGAATGRAAEQLGARPSAADDSGDWGSSEQSYLATPDVRTTAPAQSALPRHVPAARASAPAVSNRPPRAPTRHTAPSAHAPKPATPADAHGYSMPVAGWPSADTFSAAESKSESSSSGSGGSSSGEYAGQLSFA